MDSLDTLTLINSDDVQEALRLWHGGKPTRWPLHRLRLGFLLSNDENSYDSLAEGGPAAKNRAILNRGLEELRLISPEAEDLLRERYENRRDVVAVSNSLNISESSLYYRQKQAITQLTDILIKLEQYANRDWQERMMMRLGLPSYTELVGITTTKANLLDVLLNEDDYFIIAVDGLGGLGKTALADHIMREVINTKRFDEIAWVTAKQTHLSTLGRLQVESNRPALTYPMLVDNLATQFDLPQTKGMTQLQRQRYVKQFLTERACFIVIDNLETVADYRTLLPELRRWQRPSKFLLTSRVRLLDEAEVFSLSLRELEMDAAFQLIRAEAQRTGFQALADAGGEELKQIYELVGGNPLALKLIVGQLRFRSLPRVLDRFASKTITNSPEGLFDYIYHDIWETLGDESKMTLLALTQAGETGFTFEHIVELSELSPEAVDHCLEKLIMLSLVDLSGSLIERRYRLHRLTEVFLLRMLGEE
ncbi:MAG: hypothetical protein KC413_18150 [Anaerolineales bacterium]|nr:hypothetical protein [Anaerolineales bacterium]MCA9977690.1 hypothetical protein [Anaerolineales bacterium]MCB8968960.1 hypothetical protein [Ardenticatenaceae bacterium]